MRTVNVVVIGVLSQHALQLSASEDEHPVQHLTPNGADPTLRVGMSFVAPSPECTAPRSLQRQDRIERGGELRIPIADQEPEPADAVCEPYEQIPGLLDHPRPHRLRCHREHVDPPGRHLDHKQHLQPLQ
jgi:hypothetical protein